MIRKAVIVVLTLGALSNAVLWCVCTMPHPRGPRSDMEQALGVWKKLGIWKTPDYSLGGSLVYAILTYRLAEAETAWATSEAEFSPSIFRVGCYSPHGCARSVSHRMSYARYRQFGGFQFHSGSTCCAKGKLRNSYMAGVPLWASFVCLSAYPTIAFLRGPLRRWRRRKRGECVNCGYNLTGNVTGVCSECGTPVR